MEPVTAIGSLCIVGMLSLTSFLGINNSNKNTEKITTTIKQTEKVAPKEEPKKEESKKETVNANNYYENYNHYETHNHYEEVTKEVDEEEVKEMVHDAYFEERVKQAEEESKQLTYEELQALIYDGSKENAPTNSVDNNSTNKGFKSVLKCEVCEKTGTELEAWTDVNNIKHYTCKERCTGGLDVLYGE